MSARPKVVVLRGHQANPWELRPWELLQGDFDVTYLRTGRNWFDPGLIGLPGRPVRSLRDLLPAGRLGDAAVRVPGDRYLGLRDALAGADIVHSQELGYWYSAQAARAKSSLGFRLALTVWETLPFLDAYRNVRTRPYRRRVLHAADLFLPATERASLALQLEGVDPGRIRVSPPGVDLDRFGADPAREAGPPVVLSAGRLVWEKGHQDVLRALALLRRDGVAARVVIVGAGPERDRLQRYATELGVGDAVELRAFVPYDEMPRIYAAAHCLVLASLPTWSWEEQFGMVLAEALAAGLPIVASTSGAIPEVAGPTATYFAPGDSVGLAGALREVLGRERPGEVADPERVARFSVAAAAERLAAAYTELLAR
ncbi:MAG TPA: glycosyltransferase family 4 protein [Solirubrobacteraceae bacterium]